MSLKSLNEIEYSDTVEFLPNISEGKVVKVYDGDTITIGFYMMGNETPYRMPVRLLGIDTPEMRDKNVETKARAKVAQQFLSSQVLGKIVQLRNLGKEKYGRLLADVYCDDVHINQLMIDTGNAVAYFGGTK
jgi:micrococcal nuclease